MAKDKPGFLGFVKLPHAILRDSEHHKHNYLTINFL